MHLAERWLSWRNGLLASPSFQRRAAAFWPTRWVARRRARELFDLVGGFVYSQVLLACVRLRLFELLAERPADTGELAPRLGLDESACERLMEAAAALRLVERTAGCRWALGVLGAPMAGNAGLQALVEHHAALYADLADPVALLRRSAGSTRLGALWAYAGAGQPADLPTEAVAPYSAVMAASAPLVAEELLAAYPVARHRCLLDVGGGEGAFLQRAAELAPALRLMLFDLPAVAERATRRFIDRGLASRASTHGGDFLRDALPTGADLATLLRVVHDHDDGPALRLLQSVRRCLVPGGTLLLAEPMAGTPGAQAMGGAYFGMYLFAMGSGRPRTPDQLTALLRQAGFSSVRPLPTRIPLQAQLLCAR